MAGWVYRMLRLSTVVGCSVAAFAAVMATSGAGEPVRERGDASVRVLQMNLCDSGHAHCYTGRSVAEASEVIRAEVPDVVTVNEVCQDDVAALEAVLTGDGGGGGGGGPWCGRVGVPGGVGPAHRCRDPVPQRPAVRDRPGRAAGGDAAGVRRRRRRLPDAGRGEPGAAGVAVSGSTCCGITSTGPTRPGSDRRRPDRRRAGRRWAGRRRRLYDTPGQRQPGRGPGPVRLPARHGDPGGPGPGRIGTGDPGR